MNASGPPVPAGPGDADAAAAVSYAVYDAVATLFGVLAVPALPVLALTRHGSGLGERLGRLPAVVSALERPIWVHAASVGEALAAEPLLRELRDRYPGVPRLLSTTTATGREVARTRLPIDAAILLPVDPVGIVDRVMRRLRPSALVIIETEIWPGLIRAARRTGVPRLIVSGRISERAARRYEWIRWLTRAVFAQVDGFAMQSAADATRIVALGAPVERVEIVGNLKFARSDLGVAPAGARSLAIGERPVLIAASTHPGEEHLALDACGPLWAAHPTLLLVVAPRRPERFDEVARLVAATGRGHARRTALSGGVPADAQVLVLDTVGELPALLPAARAVFVGGTVARVGGHNVTEPALCGKPVAFGPHTSNVAVWAEALLSSGAAVRIDSAPALSAVWSTYLADPATAVAAGARGREVVAAHADVAARTAAFVGRWVDGQV